MDDNNEEESAEGMDEDSDESDVMNPVRYHQRCVSENRRQMLI